MLMPKRVKFRKFQRGRLRGNAHRGNRVEFGDYGLQSLQLGWIKSRCIEAGRVAATRMLGGEGRVWIRIFPHKSITSRPAETRMGKGKGEPAFWVAEVKPGTILFEVGGVAEAAAKEALARTAAKLPVKCRMVARKRVAGAV